MVPAPRWSTLSLVLAILLFGCGGGSGNGVVVPPGVLAAFQPDPMPAGPKIVSLAQSSASADLVTVVVRLTDVDNVYGAAFDLGFDSSRGTFVNWAPGSLLDDGGNVPDYQVNQVAPGRLVVSATRTGQVPGVDVAGTRTLMSFTFRLSRVGSGRLDFAAPDLLDDQLQPQPIPGVVWSGGLLVGS